MKHGMMLVLLISGAALPAVAADFGVAVDTMLADKSMPLFGIVKPLAATADASPEAGYRTATSTPADSVALAEGLSAEFVTRDAGNHLDMMAFYPTENPTHLIACIEGDAEEIAAGKMNPGVQRIALADGKVETIVRGTNSCDGIRTTAWGTILFTEEDDLGGAYEILNPLAITDAVAITDRATGATTDAAAVIRRMALPTMAWEGIGLMSNGVIYAGDELRPGTDVQNADGGAIFKFVPAIMAAGPITTLDASPFAAGKTYAMQVECIKNAVQFGQGCETGNALWIEVDPTKARAEADAKGATGYYRPEDLHLDPMVTEGARFCWTNTGNEGGKNYAEVMCATDSAPETIPVPDAELKAELTTTVTRFIEGDQDANSFDNLDFQPGTGNLYVIEDHPNGDIWACLPDGADRNLKSDGCIKMLSVKDTSAEPTGFIFSADGSTAYLSIQHSDDTAMPLVDGYGTDDLLKITGFAPVAK